MILGEYILRNYINLLVLFSFSSLYLSISNSNLFCFRTRISFNSFSTPRAISTFSSSSATNFERRVACLEVEGVQSEGVQSEGAHSDEGFRELTVGASLTLTSSSYIRHICSKQGQDMRPRPVEVFLLLSRMRLYLIFKLPSFFSSELSLKLQPLPSIASLILRNTVLRLIFGFLSSCLCLLHSSKNRRTVRCSQEDSKKLNLYEQGILFLNKRQFNFTFLYIACVFLCIIKICWSRH